MRLSSVISVYPAAMAATSLQLPLPVPSPHTSRPGSASSQHSAAFAANQRPAASPFPSPPLSPLPSPLTTPRIPADTASLPGKVLPSGRYEIMSVARYKQRIGCLLSCREPGIVSDNRHVKVRLTVPGTAALALLVLVLVSPGAMGLEAWQQARQLDYQSHCWVTGKATTLHTLLPAVPG